MKERLDPGSAAASLVLAFNAGSSSIKFALFAVADRREVARGLLDLQRRPVELVLRHGGDEERLAIDAPVTGSLREVLDAMLAQLESHEALGGLAAVTHRVVHGGLRFTGPARLDSDSIAQIEALTPLAPLHQEHSLRLIRAVQGMRPGLPQVASFDTAFHATQEPLARRLALPRALHDEGLQRYGFHGLSYAHVARELARRAPAQAAGRVVALHLGSGASLCALRAGRSVDCSMGFSTLDGVPMGTRCGALDPGALLYMLQQRGMRPAEVADLLYHRSGLLGVSGCSADVRELRARAGTLPAAAEALDLFAYRCAGETCRLAASLGGLDAIVFTAGVGEHDAATRAAVCDRLAWLGVALDAAANEKHASRIDQEGSAVAVHVLAADEERILADEAIALLDGRSASRDKELT